MKKRVIFSKLYFLFTLMFLSIYLLDCPLVRGENYCQNKISEEDLSYIKDRFKTRIEELITFDEIEILSITKDDKMAQIIKDRLNSDPEIHELKTMLNSADLQILKTISTSSKKEISQYGGEGDLTICVGCGYIYCMNDEWLYGTMCGISVCYFITDYFALCIPI
jgi:hypothetical protein